MKRIVLWAAVAVLGAVSAQAQLVNPSFETEGAQQDLAQDWSRWGNWINGETVWTPV